MIQLEECNPNMLMIQDTALLLFLYGMKIVNLISAMSIRIDIQMNVLEI